MIKKIKTIKKNKEVKEDLILPEIHHDRATTNFISDNNFNFGDPPGEYKINPVMSKFSGELFRDEVALVPNPIIRVKHIKSAGQERWRIFNDNKNIFTLEGSKVSKKEKQFLYSVEGSQFLLAQSKAGNLTVSGIKKEIKPKLKELSAKSKKSIR